MNNDQPSQKSLDEVQLLVQRLGPESVITQFQQAAVEIARQQQKLEQELKSFQQRQDSWELERQQSVVDIEEQSRQLADAWLQLESNRRTQRLAANSTAHQPMIDQAPSVPVPMPDGRTMEHPAPVNSLDQQGSRTPSLREQFQLLQRERQRS